MSFPQQLTDFLSERADERDWRAFLDTWYAQMDAFSAAIGEHVDEGEMGKFLLSWIIPALRNGFTTSDRQRDLFRRVQEVGFHLLPVHYYSPVPDTSAIPEGVWDFRYDTAPGWSLNVPAQLELLTELGGFASELEELSAADEAANSFDWSNSQFSPTDASVYYAMIRHYRPARVLEVGGGYSTCMAALAALRNGDTAVDAIEPWPPPFLRAERPGLRRLIEAPVQSLPVDTFTSLEANDILFIDSSHVCKVGSDVTWLILEILPRLQPGVIIHFHDIFLPWNLPRKWTEEHRLFWNEQYLLLAFLQGNRDFEVLLGTQFLSRCHPERVQQAFRHLDVVRGASFWIRRVR